MSEILPLGWFNGAVVELSKADPSIASISLHMGTGVFDGVMAYWTEDGHRLFRAADHFARFKRSAEQMGMPFAWSVEQLTDAAGKLVRQRPGATCYVRPFAYRAAPELWLTGAEGRPVDVAIFAVPTGRLLGVPMTCHISGIERVSNAAMPISWKVSGLYVNSFLARRGAEQAGVNDAIMLDRRGFVAEASAANVFLVEEDGLHTPPLGGDVFPGITRRTIIELCRELGLRCTEADIRPEAFETAAGAFLCSTLMEIRPISALGDLRFDTAAHPIYKEIALAFDRLVVSR